ncbi:MAG: BrnT family toxin [Actinomycetota bacterium]|nr:BrnT family toxin [Actinomycetota bacterium]
MREIRWTDKSEDHIAGHNVTPEEVEQVVYTRPRLVLKGTEGTEYVFGTTESGRYLLVVLAESIDGRAYVVTARDMTDTERQAFRRKGR